MRWQSTVLAMFVAAVAWAADSDQDISQLQLDDLLKTSIASQKAETVRETPGVVTVITRDEIVSTGARDLVDVLWLVPGFSAVATDVEGVVDFSFRGIWAHEGKILLMVDGQPMNELLFDDNMLGHHFPVDQIQEVDVIRGPGSALYGGWAELGVINIITRSTSDLKGATASITYGQMTGAPGLFNATAAAGATSLLGVNDLDVSLAATWGTGHRSDATYTDFGDPNGVNGVQSYSMAGSSALGPLFVNLGARYRDLRLRILYDGYHLDERDSYGTVQPTPAHQSFNTLIADLSYDWKIGSFTISPRFTFKNQVPWAVRDPNSPDYFDTSVNRYNFRLTVSDEVLPTLSVLLGTEDYLDHAWVNNPSLAGSGSQTLFANNATEVSYVDLGFFGELKWQSIIGALTAGARYEHHNVYGDSFVPRIALTRSIGDFHFKALYSFAFRAPGIEDIALSPTGNIVPEHTRTAELELGYQLSRLSLTANAFDITIQDPIVYGTVQNPQNPGATVQRYVNYPRTGTQGLELQARLRGDWGFVNVSYSFYSAFSVFAQSPKNTIDLYSVPNDPTLLIGAPAHKIALNSKIVLWRGLSISPSGVWTSARPGFYSGDGAGNGNFGFSSPTLLVNVYAQYADLVPGLDVGVGLYNVFNQIYLASQAYNSGHAPLPLESREVLARVAYRLPF